MSYLDELDDVVGAPGGEDEDKQHAALIDTFSEVLRTAVWVFYNNYNMIDGVEATSDEPKKKAGSRFITRVELGAASTISVPASHIYAIYDYHCGKRKVSPLPRAKFLQELEGQRCRLVPGAGINSSFNAVSHFGRGADELMQRQLRVIRFYTRDLLKLLSVDPSEIVPMKILKTIKEDYPHVSF